MNSAAHVRQAVMKVRQRGLARRNQRRVERFERQAARPIFADHALIDGVERARPPDDDIGWVDEPPDFFEAPACFSACDRLE